MNASTWLRLLAVLLRLVGYLSAQEAAGHGFTHHGKYFGLPIWMTGGDGPQIACKWAPLDHLIPLVVLIEGMLREVFYPEREPGIQILQGPAIEPPSTTVGGA